MARDLNAGCWYGWDALGLAGVAYFGQQQQWGVASIFTSSFFVWTRLPGSPFDGFRLLGFNAFLEASDERGAVDAGIQKARLAADGFDHTPVCLVCWSADQSPLLLPCEHLVCRECLEMMKNQRRTCCPMCRRVLFHNNDSVRCAIHKAVASALTARLTADGIYILLQLWHGQYWEASKSALTFVPRFYCLKVLHTVTLTRGVEWWQFGIFDYLLPLPIANSRFVRSAWLPAMFTLLFSFNVLGDLRRIRGLYLIVERIVHQEPFAQLHAQ